MTLNFGFFGWGLALFIITFVALLAYCKMNDVSLGDALDSIKEFFANMFGGSA